MSNDSHEIISVGAVTVNVNIPEFDGNVINNNDVNIPDLNNNVSNADGRNMFIMYNVKSLLIRNDDEAIIKGFVPRQMEHYEQLFDPTLMEHYKQFYNHYFKKKQRKKNV